LIRPSQRDRTVDQALEIEARRLSALEDGALDVGREKGDRAEGALVGAGRRAR